MSELTTWPVACATGHRRLDADVWGWVEREMKRAAVKLRDEFGCTVGMSGMALGVDLAWFDIVDATDGLAPWACVPYPQQPDHWLPEQRSRWREAIERAGEHVRYIGNLRDVGPKDRSRHASQLLHDRNDAMLRAAQVVVAVYDRRRNKNSGTYDMFLKAQGLRGLGPFGRGPRIVRPIIHINPEVRQTRMVVSHLSHEQQRAIKEHIEAQRMRAAA